MDLKKSRQELHLYAKKRVLVARGLLLTEVYDTMITTFATHAAFKITVEKMDNKEKLAVEETAYEGRILFDGEKSARENFDRTW